MWQWLSSSYTQTHGKVDCFDSQKLSFSKSTQVISQVIKISDYWKNPPFELKIFRDRTSTQTLHELLFSLLFCCLTPSWNDSLHLFQPTSNSGILTVFNQIYYSFTPFSWHRYEPFHSQDLISNSPYYLPYNSCDIDLENLVLNQRKIP